MNINTVEKTCHEGCGWREAYMRQTEIVQAMMEESDQVFIKTRDMVGLLSEIYSTNHKPIEKEIQPRRRRYGFE